MNNENKNNNNLLMYIIIILLIILIGIGGVLVYKSYSDNNIVNNDNNVNDSVNENNKDEDNNTDKDEENNNSEIEDNKDISENKKELYNILYENISCPYYDIHNGFNELGYYYHNFDYRKTEDMDEVFKLYLTVSYIIGNTDYENYVVSHGYSVPINIFKNAYKSLFGKLDFNLETINNLKKECPGATLSDSNEYIDIFDGCGDTGMPNILMEVVRYESDMINNEFYIYEVVGYPSYLGEVGVNDGDLINLYSNEEETNLVASNFELYEDDLIDYKDKLSMYKYTFKYNDNGDGVKDYKDYYFYSVEKVK